METQELLNFAIEAGSKAGGILLQFHGKSLDPIWTSRTHFSTEADQRSDDFFRGLVVARYPAHSILSEEGEYVDGKSEYTWIYDALDGTLNYARRISDDFCVSIALAVEKCPILGVINAPKKQEIYWASSGGAFVSFRGLSPQLLKVSNETIPERAIVGINYGKSTKGCRLPAIMKKLMDMEVKPTCVLSSAMQLCALSRGSLDGYVAVDLNPEDAAGGVAIARMAGAIITNAKGKAWTTDDKDIVAANPILHPYLLDAAL